MQLLIGTNNTGKVIEISEVLAGLPLTLVTPTMLNLSGEVEETKETFEGNALLKARHFFTLSGLPTLADDSGIIVEALEKELGVQTRRWGAGAEASDQEWIDYFLRRMNHESNKNARFVCCLAYIDVNGTEHIFEGECEGSITHALEASYLPGLPISGCFKPNGFDSVYSAMTVEQKNSTSHRGKALSAFQKFLKSSELST